MLEPLLTRVVERIQELFERAGDSDVTGVPTGFADLDSKTSGEILKLMRESVDAYKQTTVMVTHDARAAAIADRVLFLADGRIVEELPRSGASEILAAMGRISE